MAEIAASSMAMEEHAWANEELRKTNMELRKNLQQSDRRSNRERTSNLPVRDTPMPFLEAIIDKVVASHYITPEMAFFTGIKDPESHVAAFND